MTGFVCGRAGCHELVPGIYCPEHRGEQTEEVARTTKSERMRGLWKNRRAELLAAIAAAGPRRGRVARAESPALEGL